MNLVKTWLFLTTLAAVANVVIHAGQYCAGEAFSCCIQGYGTKESCEQNGLTGCKWEPKPGTCSCKGTPKPCDSFDVVDCEKQEGCYLLSDYKCQIVLGTNEVFCYKMFFPANGFFTMYRHCPFESNPNHLECSFCNIYQAYDIYDNFDFDTTPRCNRCTLCSDRVSWDCSNIATGECAITNCKGECGEDECVPSLFNFFCK